MRTIAELRDLPPQALLTEREVESLYSFKSGTLRNWRVSGRGPRFVKVHRSIRYTIAAVEEFFAAREQRV